MGARAQRRGGRGALAARSGVGDSRVVPHVSCPRVVTVRVWCHSTAYLFMPVRSRLLECWNQWPH